MLTPELLRRAERFNDAFHLARMTAGRASCPELGIEVQRFGPATAIRVEAPFLRSKNRVLGFSEAAIPHLSEIVGFFAERGLPCSLTFDFDAWTPELFDRLVAVGFRSAGSAGPPARFPAPYEPVEGLVVRASPPDERDRYLDLYRRAFDARWPVTEDELCFQWIEDGLAGARRFVAEIDGKPVAMASMAILDGIAYLATCGVLPEFRRRGIQNALIRARVGAANAAGCVLVLGGGRLFSPPRRNFERCGFSPLPLGMAWSWAPS